MNNRSISITSIILGFVFIIIAIIYWSTPAGSLPSFVPGYISGSDHIHFTHGLASIILALGSFALAWFKSGRTGGKTPLD